MRILIAIPCMDTFPRQFVESLLELERPEGTSTCLKPNSLIYDSRNLLSLTAIEKGYDYVLWLDSDMTVPRDTISRLLSAEADMVTGLYVKRTIATSPVLFDVIQPPDVVDGHMVKRVHEYLHYPRDSVFEVAGCGFGCVLTSVKLLKEVWDKFGPAFAPFVWGGEDVSFCYRVNQLGHKILCDSRVKCGHVGSFIYTEDLLHTHGGEGVEKR